MVPKFDVRSSKRAPVTPNSEHRTPPPTPSGEREDALAGRAALEGAEGLVRLVERETMGDDPVQTHIPVHDEAGALGQAVGAEGPRAVDGQLLVDDIPADV